MPKQFSDFTEKNGAIAHQHQKTLLLTKKHSRDCFILYQPIHTPIVFQQTRHEQHVY